MVLVPFQTASLLHGMLRLGRKHPQRKYVFFWFLLLSFLNYTSEAPHPACFPFHSPAEVSPCFTPGHLAPGQITLQRNVFFVRTHNFSHSFSLKDLKNHTLKCPYSFSAPAFPFSLFFTTAGQPAARESSGISFTTTLPAAMTQRFPMVTPGQTTTPPPNQQSSPMVMG